MEESFNRKAKKWVVERGYFYYDFAFLYLCFCRAVKMFVIFMYDPLY